MFDSAAYLKVKRAHFRGAFVASPEMPDITLGVGDAESMAPTGIRYNLGAAAQAVKKREVKTMDDIINDTDGATVSLENFPYLDYIGGASDGY